MSKIVAEDYNEEADIDLSMEYHDDGEIVLNGDPAAAHIDNSYEAGIGALHVMAPPSASAPPTICPAPVVAAAVVPQQQITFQVQVPPGVVAGQQLQISHPNTGAMLVVQVPQGVAPGGVFSVTA